MSYFDIVLPKWPQMIVTGKKVTMEQAKDIIFRTDSFLTSYSSYAGGNNRSFNEMYREISGLSKLDKLTIENDWQRIQGISDALRNEIGYVGTSYVHNSWASCSYIYGPYGFCHPSGKIEYSDNIGKWPSVEDVYEDWVKIAEAFPYLDINVTLMDGEGCEDDSNPLLNFRILDGTVTMTDPDLSVHKNYGTRDIDEGLLGIMMGRSEQGLPIYWVEEYAKKVKDIIEPLFEVDYERNAF